MQKIELELLSEQSLTAFYQFLEDYWEKGHIFTRSKKLLTWQHWNQSSRTFNFVIAKDAGTGEVLGILGFIPSEQFHDSNNICWLAIWQVATDKAPLGLGMKLVQFVKQKHKDCIIAAVGLSDTALKLYRAIGYKIGTLNHYVIPNPTLSSYRLCDLSALNLGKKNSGCTFNVCKVLPSELICSEVDGLSSGSGMAYLSSRYINHPIYCYMFFLIRNSAAAIVAIAVAREVSCQQSSAIKVVEMLGDATAFVAAANAFSDYLASTSYEYLDIYTSLGLDVSASSSVFDRRALPIVVPNHFEPFELRNVDISYASTSELNGIAIYRGQSDQDRPRGSVQ